jgi:hypothetical protein
MGKLREDSETRRIGWLLCMLGRLPHGHAVRVALLPVVFEMVRARRRVASALTLERWQ